MRRLLAALGLLLAPLVAWADVTVQAGYPKLQDCTAASSDTCVVSSFTPPANSLLVTFCISGYRTITSITSSANGSWTSIATGASATWGVAGAAYLVTGASPSAMTVTCTFGAADFPYAAVFAFSGNDTGAPIGASNGLSLQGTAVTPSQSLTPQTSGSMVLSAIIDTYNGGTLFTAATNNAFDVNTAGAGAHNAQAITHNTSALTAGTPFTTGASAPTTNGGAMVSLEVRAASTGRANSGLMGFWGFLAQPAKEVGN